MAIWLPAAYVMLNSSRRNRQRMAETLIPFLAPVPAPQRAAFAALTVDQQVRDAERREERVAAEAVSALETIIAKEEKVTEQELAAFPTLSGVLDRVPDLRARIVGIKGMLPG